MIEMRNDMPDDMESLLNDLDVEKTKKEQLCKIDSFWKNITATVNCYKQMAKQYVISSKNRYILMNTPKHCFKDSDSTNLSLYELNEIVPDAADNKDDIKNCFQQANITIDYELRKNREASMVYFKDDSETSKYNYLRVAANNIQRNTTDQLYFVQFTKEKLDKSSKLFKEHSNRRIKYSNEIKLKNEQLVIDMKSIENEELVIEKKIENVYISLSKSLENK